MKYRRTKQYKVIGTISAKQVASIHDEEVFDCLKKRIDEYKPEQKKELTFVKKPKSLKFKKNLSELFKIITPQEILCDPWTRETKKQYRSTLSKELYWALCSFRTINKKERKRIRKERKCLARANGAKRITYAKYMNSKLWDSVKNRYFQRNARKCAVCESSKHIHLHHMVYGKWGEEPDDHLIPLCKVHHDGYHAAHGTKRNMLSSTWRYIKTERASLNATMYP